MNGRSLRIGARARTKQKRRQIIGKKIMTAKPQGNVYVHDRNTTLKNISCSTIAINCGKPIKQTTYIMTRNSTKISVISTNILYPFQIE